MEVLADKVQEISIPNVSHNHSHIHVSSSKYLYFCQLLCHCYQRTLPRMDIYMYMFFTMNRSKCTDYVCYYYSTTLTSREWTPIYS